MVDYRLPKIENSSLSFVVDYLDWLNALGFNDTSTLWVILCSLPEKGRKEIEEEMKERKGKKEE